MLIKSTAQKAYVYAIDKTTGVTKTGDAANITATISKDGGATAATSDTNPTEIGGGVYAFDLTAAETSCDALAVIPVSATSNVVLSPLIAYTSADFDSLLVTNLIAISEPTKAQLALSSTNTTNAAFALNESGLSNGINVPAGATLEYAYLSASGTTLVAGKTYTISFYVVMADNSLPVPSQSSSSGDFGLIIGGAVPLSTPVVLRVHPDTGSNNVYRVYATYAAATITNQYVGVIRYAAQSGKAFRVTGFMLHEGQYAPYVKTSGATARTIRSLVDIPVSSRLATSGYTTPPTASAIATAVWASATRTLSSFGSLASDVWAAASRTLSTAPPTAAEIRADLDANSWRLAYLDVSMTSRLASSNYTVPPTANENADALLKRDWTAVSGEAGRSVLNALRFLRNKWSLSGSTLTVTTEDDSTTAWTAAVSTDSSADPVTGSDPS